MFCGGKKVAEKRGYKGGEISHKGAYLNWDRTKGVKTLNTHLRKGGLKNPLVRGGGPHQKKRGGETPGERDIRASQGREKTPRGR